MDKNTAAPAGQELHSMLTMAYNAGWDASDACDNAYNNGYSEQLETEIPQAHEPAVYQRWRATWFSNRDVVLRAIAVSPAPPAQSGEPCKNNNPATQKIIERWIEDERLAQSAEPETDLVLRCKELEELATRGESEQTALNRLANTYRKDISAHDRKAMAMNQTHHEAMRFVIAAAQPAHTAQSGEPCLGCNSNWPLHDLDCPVAVEGLAAKVAPSAAVLEMSLPEAGLALAQALEDELDRQCPPDVVLDERAAFEAAWANDGHGSDEHKPIARSWFIAGARAAFPQPVAQTERALTDEQVIAIEAAISISADIEADCHDGSFLSAESVQALRDLLAAQPESGENHE